MMKQDVYTDKGINEYLNGHFKKVITSYSYVTENIYQNPNEALIYTLDQKRGIFYANVSVFGISRHPAQMYESLSSLILFILLFLIWRQKKELTTPGRIFGIFLTYLFTLRFLYEFLKENQVAFEDNLPLNMGQWLSIPMVILGILALIFGNKIKSQGTGS